MICGPKVRFEVARDQFAPPRQGMQEEKPLLGPFHRLINACTIIFIFPIILVKAKALFHLTKVSNGYVVEPLAKLTLCLPLCTS